MSHAAISASPHADDRETARLTERNWQWWRFVSARHMERAQPGGPVGGEHGDVTPMAAFARLPFEGLSRCGRRIAMPEVTFAHVPVHLLAVRVLSGDRDQVRLRILCPHDAVDFPVLVHAFLR